MAGENSKEASGIGYLRIASGGQHYVYDKTTNACVPIPETVDSVLDDFLAHGAGAVRQRHEHQVSREELSSAVGHLDALKTRYGMFQPSPPTDLSGLLASNGLEQLLASRCRQVTLNVTEQCNQRCTYCVYSGDYPGERSHSDRQMTWPIAQEGLDRLLAGSQERVTSKLNIYGGEPLLTWGLVKRCIEYARRSEVGRRLKITLNTNLTLLRDEVARFLVAHSVHLSISLDGPKEVHDSARVFAGGAGTHDRVARQLQKLMALDPAYCREYLGIKCTFARTSDIADLFDYFSQEPFRDLEVSLHSVREPDGCGTKPCSEDRSARRRQIERLITGYLESVQTGGSPNHRLFQRIFHSVFSKIARRPLKVDSGAEVAERMCIPGASGTFVSADGRFFTCENFSHPENCIGDVERGIDTKRVRSLLSTYAGFCEELCQTCWASRLCSMCFLHTLDQGRISKERMKENCARHREAIEAAFETFLYLWQNEPASFHDHEFSLHSAVRQSRHRSSSLPHAETPVPIWQVTPVPPRPQ